MKPALCYLAFLQGYLKNNKSLSTVNHRRLFQAFQPSNVHEIVPEVLRHDHPGCQEFLRVKVYTATKLFIRFTSFHEKSVEIIKQPYSLRFKSRIQCLNTESILLIKQNNSLFNMQLGKVNTWCLVSPDNIMFSVTQSFQHTHASGICGYKQLLQLPLCYS